MTDPAEPLASVVDEERTLGRYRLRYRVARGGMGSVYLAQVVGAHGFERWVAIKVIHPHLAEERRFVDMFLDEARVMAPLSHPNVCSVLDFGEERGLPYIVMEYLQGEGFSSVLRRGKESGGLPLGLALRVVADAARGLHAAHDLCAPDGTPLGVVHRDVSPQNIHVLYDGISKVVDFGVARARGRVTHSNTGEVKGKFSYMAPESASGKTVDRRSDVFSLGVVLWESLALRRLFLRDNEAETVLAILTAPVPSLAEVDVKVPAPVEDLVSGMLARNPAARIASAELAADALEGALFGLGEPWGPAQVAGWMRNRFADRFATRNAMLRAAPLPIDEVPDVEISPTQSGQISIAGMAVPLPPRRPSRWLPLIVIGLLLGLSAAAYLLLQVGHPPQHAVRPRPPPASLPAKAPRAEPRPGAPAAVAPVAPDEPPAPVPVEPDGPVASAEEPPAVTPDPQSTAARSPTGRVPSRPPGLLNLLSVPNAVVSEGGRRLGRTPLLRVKLRPGRHTLQLRSDDGRLRRSVRVTIESGVLTARSVRLQR